MKKQVKKDKNTSKSARDTAPILKVDIDSTRYDRVIEIILTHAQAFSRQKDNAEPLFIVTPNPEIVLKARDDAQLAEIINNARFALPDGRGLVWAMRYLYGRRLEVVPGRVLFAELVREAGKRGWKVFLLGGESGVARRAARALARELVQLDQLDKLVQFDSGPRLGPDGMPVDKKQARREEEVIGEIRRVRPHFLFVGFGAPKQEKWLARNLPRLKVGVAMTVGGTLDYWAGRVPLPPAFMERLGLEWLWRLVWQPWRLPRIFRATVIFPLKVVWYKLTH